MLFLELGEFGFPVLALSGVFGSKRRGLVLECNRLDAGGSQHVEVVEHRPEPCGVPDGYEGNGEWGTDGDASASADGDVRHPDSMQLSPATRSASMSWRSSLTDDDTRLEDIVLGIQWDSKAR